MKLVYEGEGEGVKLVYEGEGGVKWVCGDVSDDVRVRREKSTSLKGSVGEVRRREGVQSDHGHSSYTAVGEELEELPLEQSSRHG